jgi:hypothetical protein
VIEEMTPSRNRSEIEVTRGGKTFTMTVSNIGAKPVAPAGEGESPHGGEVAGGVSGKFTR